MANFCRYCGNPVRPGANFCPACGKSLAKASAQPGNRQAEAPKRQQPSYAAPQTRSETMRSSATQAQPRTASARVAEAARQAAITPQVRELTASASAGEIDCGELALSGLGGVTGSVTQVLSPFSGILQSIGAFFGGVFRIFKKPSALIGTVILAALWFVLAQFRGSDSGLVKALSWLTFSEGGFDRSALGAVGGVLGKGTVVAALVSLFNGGLKNLFKGVGALFTGHGEKRGIFSTIFGILIGGAVYFAFVGKNASGATAMAGISGALLSLEALGGGSGKIWELAQSLTSRAANGVRTAVRGKCDGLLTGLTLSFALATVLSALGVTEGLL